MPLSVELVPCLKDNYAYLISDETGLCAVVDPSERDPVHQALAGRKLTHILNTHHHYDHTGGNLALKAETGAVVVGPGKDRERIPGIDVGVDESTGWQFGARDVRILEIPAHTRAHIAFAFEADDLVFTGDTLFSMGCGRLFEGAPAMMWASLSKLLALEGAMRIYCGHEYTLNNGSFALTLEPGNADLQARMREVEGLRSRGQPTIPSALAVERKTNPFLRPDSPEIRRTLDLREDYDATAFAEMRRRKDAF